MALGIGRLVKRYCLVTLLPITVFSCIYADYTRTQLYKTSLKRNEDASNYS